MNLVFRFRSGQGSRPCCCDFVATSDISVAIDLINDWIVGEGVELRIAKFLLVLFSYLYAVSPVRMMCCLVWVPA